MLGHRLRRWHNIKPTFAERLVPAGMSFHLNLSFYFTFNYNTNNENVCPTKLIIVTGFFYNTIHLLYLQYI